MHILGRVTQVIGLCSSDAYLELAELGSLASRYSTNWWFRGRLAHHYNWFTELRAATERRGDELANFSHRNK